MFTVIICILDANSLRLVDTPHSPVRKKEEYMQFINLNCLSVFVWDIIGFGILQGFAVGNKMLIDRNVLFSLFVKHKD